MGDAFASPIYDEFCSNVVILIIALTYEAHACPKTAFARVIPVWCSVEPSRYPSQLLKDERRQSRGDQLNFILRVPQTMEVIVAGYKTAFFTASDAW